MVNIQRSDIGVQFIVTITDEQTSQILDLSSATNIQFIFRRPDKHVYIVSGSLYTSGKDGKVTYISQDTDLTIQGIWKLQVSYQLNDAFKTTIWDSFQVLPNLYDLT